MNQPPRRPVRPARTPTSRPRRVAGVRPDAPATEPAVEPAEESGLDSDAEPAEESTPERARPVVLDKRAAAPTVADAVPVDEPTPEEPARGRRPLLVLVALLVVLLGVGAAEVVYLTSDEGTGSQQVTAERPVQAPELEVRRVVDQAATAAELILSGSSTDYDAQVAEATATMTEPFAEQYRQTKADIEEQFVEQQTEVVIDVSAQGVVTASDDEIVALLFLTQTTQKGTRGGVQPVQYRVTVTMTDTADGWLVSNLVAL